MRTLAVTTCFVAWFGLLPPAVAAEPGAALTFHRQSGIQYVSGGMSEAEREELKRVARKYPMQLVFTAEGQAEEVKGVRLTVKDLRGDKVIEAVTQGPWFYFDPPSGRWTMEAELNGETVSRTVDLIGRRYIVLEFHFNASGG